jgi:hypothetical protein
VTDDTVAIQAAITALEAATNKNTLYFPSGTYRLNKPTYGEFYWPSYYQYYRALELGRTDLAGRDLFFVGDTNAVLYSTLSWVRTKILLAHGSFRTLSFRGLTFRKEPTALPFTGTVGAEGVYVHGDDLRRVESVDFAQCTFDNCHGGVWITGAGHDIRGHLAHFRMANCDLLNLYGSNMTNAAVAYGGGVQVYLDAWVGEALYHDNFFDGGSENPDPIYNPDGVRLDGSHFGSPLNLVFTNNVVMHMQVEAVMQSDDPFMSTTASPFTVPPVGGPATNLSVVAFPSTFVPGQILTFRTSPVGGGELTNILLAVAEFNPTNSTLAVTNPGLTPSVTGMLINWGMSIYSAQYDPTTALISGNIVSDPSQIGYTAICPNAKSIVTHNFIRGYDCGIYQYPPDHNPYNPPHPGTLIASNIVIPANVPTPKYGIIAGGPGITILHNLVIKESTNSFVGVDAWNTNMWIRGNTVLSRFVAHQPYLWDTRSVGIGFRGSSFTTSIDNRTYGMDVGIGPDQPDAVSPHRVISHFSKDDTLPIDPVGVY